MSKDGPRAVRSNGLQALSTGSCTRTNPADEVKGTDKLTNTVIQDQSHTALDENRTRVIAIRVLWSLYVLSWNACGGQGERHAGFTTVNLCLTLDTGDFILGLTGSICSGVLTLHREK